ncbi:MAG: acetyl-CoA carboxylase biotin carboxyl carrier protein [Pirellulales bacterium]|nr:acetyl-CoA carboxylase biotin carboxyl carrier protein [Pirellulales bacterium]
MSNPSSPQDIFDVRKIRRLVELMKEHELSELDLQQGEVRIQLRRAGPAVTAGAPPAPGTYTAAPAAAAAPPAAAESAPAADDSRMVLIKSPMVGTFYAAPDPEAPAFVKVGDHVGPETTVCIVEAMKVFNQIPAEVSGKIVAVLVENGQSVEFGQSLFRVDPQG